MGGQCPCGPLFVEALSDKPPVAPECEAAGTEKGFSVQLLSVEALAGKPPVAPEVLTGPD